MYSETTAPDALLSDSQANAPGASFQFAPPAALSANNASGILDKPVSSVRADALPADKDAPQSPAAAPDHAAGDPLASLRSLLAQHLTAEPGSGAEPGQQSLESLVNMLYTMTAPTGAGQSPAALTAPKLVPQPAQSAQSAQLEAIAPEIVKPETVHSEAIQTTVVQTAVPNAVQAEALTVSVVPPSPPAEEAAASATAVEKTAVEKTAVKETTVEETPATEPAPTEAVAEETRDTNIADAQNHLPALTITEPIESALPVAAGQENAMPTTILERDFVEEAPAEHAPSPDAETAMETTKTAAATPALTVTSAGDTPREAASQDAASLSLSAPVLAPVIPAQPSLAPAPVGVMSFTLTSGQTSAALHIAPQTHVSAIVLEQRPDEIVLKLQITP